MREDVIAEECDLFGLIRGPRTLNGLLAEVGESVERIAADPDAALERLLDQTIPGAEELAYESLEDIEKRLGIKGYDMTLADRSSNILLAAGQVWTPEDTEEMYRRIVAFNRNYFFRRIKNYFARAVDYLFGRG